MKGQRIYLSAVCGLAVLLHALLLLPLPLLVQALAALLLVGWLPGALLVGLLCGYGNTALDWLEHSLYAIATGYGIITVVLLALSYLPGGLASWQIYLATDLLLVSLCGCLWWRGGSEDEQTSANRTPHARHPMQYAPWLGLIFLLLIAGFLRFTHLGYAEFQGDEGRAVLRAAAVIQGSENVLFLHRKGPVEILLPTLNDALTSHLTETTARLPFTLANLVGIVAVFVLGWRLFNPVAGWVAALFLAVDGYFIGFARIVQYQSIVILTSVLVVLILVRLVQRPAQLQRYLCLAAFLLATGLLAHYEAALVVIPGLYLLWQLWRHHKPASLGMAFGGAVLTVGVTAGLFYLPYLLNPAFQHTYAYLADERIGGHLPYNNLADFFLRTTLYDTTYAVLLLIGLVLLALLRTYWQRFPAPWCWLLSGFAVLGLAATFAKADWLALGGVDYTFVFFGVLFVAVWCPHPPTPFPETVQPIAGEGEKFPERGWGAYALWLWFGVLLILALFFVGKPRTHVYVFFLPWVLIAGMVVAELELWMRARWGRLWTGMAGGLAALLLIALLGSYAYWYFVYNQVEIYRTWATNRPSGFWTLYEQPDDRSLFGFPLQNGWKTVGMLYAAGILHGAYETNDVDDWVTDWYVRAGERCLRTHQYYILADSLERKSQARKAALLQEFSQTYQLFGTVTVNNQPRLQIYTRGHPGGQPQTFAAEVFAPQFDQRLSDPQLALDTPVIEPPLAHPLHVRLGNAIWLEGYQVGQTAVRPGGVLTLTLYWRATQRIEEKYTVFNQILTPDQQIVGQLDGQPGCEAAPTDDWPVGELMADHYAVPVQAGATPGRYTLVTGMMQPHAQNRLPVYANTDQAVDNAVTLTSIQVLQGQ